MAQTNEIGAEGNYISITGGVEMNGVFVVPVYTVRPDVPGLRLRGTLRVNQTTGKLMFHDGTTESNVLTVANVTLQDVLQNSATGGTNDVIGLYHSSAANASSLELYDHLAQLTAGDNTLTIDNDTAGITSPFTVGAPTEPNHAARHGETIPLSGTLAGSPVSGDVEFDNASATRKIKGNAFDSYISFEDDGRIEINALSGSNVNMPGGVNFDAYSGIISDTDFSEVDAENPLIYAQRQYVIDYVAAHAGGGGTVTSVTGVAGETTVANNTTTPVIGIASSYTAARDSYADSAASSAASGKENSANKQNSLTADGTGVKFPTVDAVKAALLYYPRIIFASTTAYPGTGATSAILLKAAPIAANELSNGTLQVDLKARFTGTAGTKQILLYYNTSASLTGATLLATGVSHASNVPMTELRRKFSLNGTSLRGLSPTFPTFDIATSTSTDLNVTYNPANQYYIIAACVNGSSADTSTLDMFNITFIKATE